MDRKTVLLVDDEPGILTAMERLLRQEGYDLLTASGGREGLLRLETHKVHVVISDQRMPGMTGDAFLQRVKERWPDIVRVLLTGYTEVGNVVETAAESDLFYCSLLLPCGDEELQNTIRQCLQRSDALEHHRRMTEPVPARNGGRGD